MFLIDKCPDINIYAKMVSWDSADGSLHYWIHLPWLFEPSSCQRSCEHRGSRCLKQRCVIYYWSDGGIFWDADQTRRQKHDLETHLKSILCRLRALHEFFLLTISLFFGALHLFTEFEDCFTVTVQNAVQSRQDQQIKKIKIENKNKKTTCICEGVCVWIYFFTL